MMEPLAISAGLYALFSCAQSGVKHCASNISQRVARQASKIPLLQNSRSNTQSFLRDLSAPC
jgi:hypothetical protein